MVARGVVILAEYSTTTADYSLATAPILESLAAMPPSPLDPAEMGNHPNPRSRIFIHGGHRIHLLMARGLVFLAVAESIFPSQPVQAMLEGLVRRFIEIYGDGWEMPLITIPFSVSEFAGELKAGVEKCNQMVSEARGQRSKSVMIMDSLLEETKEELDETRDVLVISMERLLARGERLQELQVNAERVNQSALEFQRRSLYLRRRMWYRNQSLLLILVIVIVASLYVFARIVKGMFPPAVY